MYMLRTIMVIRQHSSMYWLDLMHQENAQYRKAIFKDKTKLKRELVAKGQKLSPSQIPSDPGFYNDTTSQKFTQWSDSTDANKKKVDLKTAQMTKSVILNADYDKPSVIIKQMIREMVSGIIKNLLIRLRQVIQKEK